MPLYVYKCRVCGKQIDEFREVDRRNDPVLHCGHICDRDQHAEKASTGSRVNDWTSINAGVGVTQVTEANKTFAHLGVHFDSEGIAHGSGGREQKLKFLKARGFHDENEVRGGH